MHGGLQPHRQRLRLQIRATQVGLFAGRAGARPACMPSTRVARVKQGLHTNF